MTLREAARTRAFWLFSLALGLNTAGMSVPLVHLAPYARDQGISKAVGVTLTGLVGVGSLIGRFALAGLGDRLNRRATLAALMACMAVAEFMWLFSSGMVNALGVLFGPPFAGYAYDASGSYAVPILASALLQVAAMALALAIRKAPSHG